MADLSAIGGFGELFGGVNLSGMSATLWFIIPIIILFLIVGVSIFVGLWYLKFRYIAQIYSVRANGDIVESKTRGGFFRNIMTKQESFRLLGWKYRGVYIPPFPNKYIGLDEKGKDMIKLLRTTEGEYIPVTLKRAKDKFLKPVIKYEEKTIDGKKVKVAAGIEYKEGQEFIVHDDYTMDWLAARAMYNRNKFTLKTALDKYGHIISLGIILAIFFLGMYFTTDYAKYAINIATGLVRESTEVPVVSALLLIPAKSLFKR